MKCGYYLHGKFNHLYDDLYTELETGKSNIKDVYSLGEKKRGFFTNNLIDSFVDSQIEKNAQLEDLLQLGIGGSFGKEKQWGAGLTGGKGWGEFNIGRSY